MSDRYQKIATSPFGKSIFSTLGLPTPVILDRQDKADAQFLSGKVLLGMAPGSGLLGSVISVLAGSENVQICCQADDRSASTISQAVESEGEDILKVSAGGEDSARFKALVFDATGIGNTQSLRALHDFFSPVVRKMENSGRIIVLGRPADQCGTPSRATAMRALEGFTRSLAKEVGKKGTTVQLVYVSDGAESQLASPLRFCLSPRSAYVSAQVIRINQAEITETPDWAYPLAGKIALVTGASRGIGKAIAEVLARDGARVVCLDVPQAQSALEEVAALVKGVPLTVDITAENAPRVISDALADQGGVDVVVHNAGITRDKTLAKMKPDWWDLVIDINLSAEERINEELLLQEVIKSNGRIICVSSMSGIAGNFGQTNYATSKAGVIGYVQAMAPILAKHDITINAVAPGFIETQMTAAIPFMTREFGRRMNSLSQGGLPRDVAETIAFFASPASSGINGNIIRVCGQSLLGA